MNLFYTIIRSIVYIPFKLLYPTKVVNKRDFPKEKRVILVCNHLSWKDILIAAIYFPGYRHFLAKKEIGKNPIIRTLAKWLGVILIDRSRADLTAMRDTIAVLKKGQGVTVFPEGTRNKTDTAIHEIKSGVVMFSLKGDAPIIPAVIHSRARLFRKNYVYLSPTFDLSVLKDRRLDTPTVNEGGAIVGEKLAATKKLLDNYVENKKNADFKRMLKEHKKARKRALAAAEKL